jgi:hypothetical protein
MPTGGYKNYPNKSRRREKESQLTEVMIHKMRLIQFVSIVNWIQMTLMKVIHKMKNMKNQESQYLMHDLLYSLPRSFALLGPLISVLCSAYFCYVLHSLMLSGPLISVT